MNRRQKKVLIIYTGGTIGMDEKLRLPSLSSELLRKRLLASVPEISRLADCDVEVAMNCDSAHMMPKDWIKIANVVRQSMKRYDGIVILHGTDTLAYTASALSFLIRPCPIPVILTGAQRPLAASLTDARRNLISSIEIAAHGPRKLLSQVMVFFDDQLLQGNQTRKKSSTDFGAFSSPKSRAIAWVGTHIQYNRAKKTKVSRTPKFSDRFDSRVALIHLTPGFPAEAFSRASLSQMRALCLIPYASGTGPTSDPQFLKFLGLAKKKNIPVVLVTDSASATGSAPVHPSQYEAGKILLKHGCIWAGAMTPECAYVKSAYILAQRKMSVAQFKKLFLKNIAAEQST